MGFWEQGCELLEWGLQVVKTVVMGCGNEDCGECELWEERSVMGGEVGLLERKVVRTGGGESWGKGKGLWE